jgi:hypothetical protein
VDKKAKVRARMVAALCFPPAGALVGCLTDGSGRAPLDFLWATSQKKSNKTMKATDKFIGRLIVGCVFACCLSRFTPQTFAIQLGIETDDDNYTRIIHFDTSLGFIYNVEESTNLINW